MKNCSISTKRTYRIRKNFKTVNNSTNSIEGDKTGLNNLSLQLPQLMVNCYMFRTEFQCGIFMVTPCINDIKHFIFQLMHTTLKKVELLKHF